MSFLASAAIDLAYCFAYYAYQDALDRLLKRTQSELEDGVRFAQIRGMQIVSQIWLGEPPRDLCGGTVPASKLIEALDDDDMRPCAIALLALNAYDGTDELVRTWSPEDLVSMAEAGTNTRWGAAYLALALGLWVRIPYDPGHWTRLLDVIRTQAAPLPVALEWQRQLMESRELQRAGDWTLAERRRSIAEEQLALLLRPEHGAAGCASYSRWKSTVCRAPEVIPTVPTQAPELRLANIAALSNASDRTGEEWGLQILRAVSQHERVVVCSRHCRELDVLLERLRAVERRPITDFACDSGVMAEPSVDGLLIVRFPNLWSSTRLLRALEIISVAKERTFSVVSAITQSLDEFAGLGSVQRALAEILEGSRLSLPPYCEHPGRVHDAFLATVRSVATAATIDEEVLSRLMEHHWPGGLSELENVARAVAQAADGRVTVGTLDRIGWGDRFAQNSSDGMIDTRILALIHDLQPASISAIVEGVKEPRRTVQRRLGVMMQVGAIGRFGRGRATRYRAKAKYLTIGYQ